jgi:Fe(3+) dicitrate transport protein
MWPLLTLALAGFAGFAPGDTLDPVVHPLWHTLPEAEVAALGVTAGATSPDEIPGCLHVLSPAELLRFNYTDPLRTLRSVPGMQLVEEDGFGLRPNIGIRGSGSDRSSRIALLEDGIPAAPAAYTAPAAYYFPSVARMSRVEVLKGSSQIAFGPVTAGGAINLISTPVPESGTEARIHTEGGSYGSRFLHASAGTVLPTRAGALAFLAEVLDTGSDGFKTLDGGGPTGFHKTDRLLKVRWTVPSEHRQSVTLKLSDVEERSHETYLGLTEADFAADPLRHPSSLDPPAAASRRNRVHDGRLPHPLRPAVVQTRSGSGRGGGRGRFGRRGRRSGGTCPGLCPAHRGCCCSDRKRWT